MGKFGAIRTVRQELPALQAEGDAPLPSPAPRRVRGRPAGKRSNPDFEPTTIFLRKDTKRAANRTLEDAATRQDLSELVESLLQQWISARS